MINTQIQHIIINTLGISNHHNQHIPHDQHSQTINITMINTFSQNYHKYTYIFVAFILFLKGSTWWVWMVYKEIRNTSCTSFVIAIKSWWADWQNIRSVCFMVNHKENHLCELFITGMYTKPYWYGFSFECGRSTNLPALVAAILCYAAERTL